jgi:hypothetical protein
MSKAARPKGACDLADLRFSNSPITRGVCEMALFICPDCKKELSTEAMICPNCGRQIKKSSTGCIIALCVVGALIFAFFHFAPDPTVAEQQQAAAAIADQPTTDTSSDPAFQPGGTYTFTLATDEAPTPTISGTTSVPNGTILLINVKKAWLPDAQERLAQGLAACGDDCLPAIGPAGESWGVESAVQNGTFSAGPFSFAKQPFRPGNYTVEIFIKPKKQNELTPKGIAALGTPVFSGQMQVKEETSP